MLKFLETLLRLIVYTIAYMAGRRSAKADINEEDLKEINRVITEREQSSAKFIDLKRRLPDFTE